MGWRKVTLTVDDVIRGRHLAIQWAFQQVWVTLSEPPDASLFAELLGPDGGCILYFSPGTMRFAKCLVLSHQGVQSEPPPKHARRLIGHSSIALHRVPLCP